MTKKFLVQLVGAVFAIAIYWLGFAVGYYANQENLEDQGVVITIPSNEELLDTYVQYKYGTGCYAETYGTVTDTSIMYDVYNEDGELIMVATETTRKQLVKYIRDNQ